MDAASILARSTLFGQLDPSELEQVAQLARTRSLAKDSMVFMQGDPGDALYGIARGKVLISLSTPEGKEFSLNLLEAGEVFGEIALLDGHPRTANARTLEETQLVVIHRAHFANLVEQHPAVALHLLQLLCARLRWNAQLIEEFSLLSVPARLARRLLTLGQLLGKPGADGETVLDIAQAELAQFLGVSRQVVNQHLQDWRRSDWIDLGRGKVILLDPDALKQVQ
ncbi:MAG: Crp/Fnr family transcriptional regulator [Xanthomonadales bacterium]|nr:Crp/Fnr family transcriptional regulator [Xanthomonadales bacterium]